MRVANLTYHNANNYGAILQAYALQNYLISKDIESEIIDFYPNIKENRVSNSLKHKAFKYLINPKDFIIKKRKQVKFDKFRRNCLNISSDIFYGDKQIKSNPPLYDIYIVGSDQIWNTDISNKSEAYFLHFVKKGYKISYAASIGKDQLNNVEKEYANKYLRHFDAVSVREKQLQRVLKTELSISAEHVLDPIFLLGKDEWKKIEHRSRLPKKYILCYMMEFSDRLVKHTKDMARERDCTPLFISPSHSGYRGKQLKGLGPCEFLYVFANANYICTNSFHGTAFSLIYKKDFNVIRHSSLNSRISSLLELVGLTERFLNGNQYKTKKIKYDGINDKLGIMIEKSKNYLNKHLPCSLESS
ncbi:polysaccharide pyruvyl transferase family protein [Natronospora cellulosivora (SeqCode)]